MALADLDKPVLQVVCVSCCDIAGQEGAQTKEESVRAGQVFPQRALVLLGIPARATIPQAGRDVNMLWQLVVAPRLGRPKVRVSLLLQVHMASRS